MTIERESVNLDTLDLSDYSLFRHGFPHHVFEHLRREAPVWKHPKTPGVAAFGGEEFWVVSKHADLLEASRDPERFRSFEGPRVQGWEPRMRGQMLITMDPPAHTRQRKLISAGFTPRMVSKLDEQARTWATSIVDNALEKGVCNFVHEVAYQLPMHMIADILGIPLSDRQYVFDLVNTQLHSLDPQHALPKDELEALQMQSFMYGRQLSDSKLANPSDDVWTQLTQVEVEGPDGETSKLSQLELDLFFIVLTIAGSETTRNAISSGLISLVQNPDQLQLLRDDPGLMTTAIEEIVRVSSPVTYFRRTAVHDTVLGGMEIKADEPVTLWYPSANFDETVFADPFRFDITRSPNPQAAFGGAGVHFCLGANLARREIKVMFEELLARVKDFEILGEPEYSVAGIQSPVSVSLKDMQVRMTAK